MKPLTEDKMRFDDRDNADFLTEEGQLKYDLSIEADEFKVWGVNTNVKLNIFRTNNSTLRNMEQYIIHNYSKHLSKDTISIQLTSPSIQLTT